MYSHFKVANNCLNITHWNMYFWVLVYKVFFGIQILCNIRGKCVSLWVSVFKIIYKIITTNMYRRGGMYFHFKGCK